jgi:O-antigen/teichoic acid export membrane protein
VLKYLSETSRLFQMVFFVVLARRFGPSVLGDVTVLITIGSAVALLIGDLGINVTTIARMSGSTESERAEVASEALFWKNAISILALLPICAGLYLTRSSESWIVLLAVAAISLSSVWLEFLCALTNGVNRLGVEVWLRIAYRGIVYGGAALVALFASVSADLVYMAVSAAVTLAAGFVLLRRQLIPVRISYRPSHGLSLLKLSLPVWVTQLAQLTYLRFDIAILGLLHVAAREIGWYAAAWKIADVLTGVPALLSAAALPLISGSSSKKSVSVIAPGYLKLMYVLPFFFVLPLAIGAGWITRLLYGDSFTGTPWVLRVLVWAVAPIFVHTFLAVLAVATKRQAQAAKIATAASILNILAAAVLVPMFGYEAMAIISLSANSLFACAMVFRFRDLTESAQFGTALKSIMSALAIYWIFSSLVAATHPLLAIFGGAGAYCFALLLLRVFTLGDLGRGWRFFVAFVLKRPVERGATA